MSISYLGFNDLFHMQNVVNSVNKTMKNTRFTSIYTNLTYHQWELQSLQLFGYEVPYIFIDRENREISKNEQNQPSPSPH